MDPAGAPRRATRTDPNRSIPAQGRAANAMHGGMAHSAGEMEADTAAQYEVEYPAKLKKLFDEDSSNESYSLPFENPENLHAHFTDLEEENLSLIQQWQENE